MTFAAPARWRMNRTMARAVVTEPPLSRFHRSWTRSLASAGSYSVDASVSEFSAAPDQLTPNDTPSYITFGFLVSATGGMVAGDTITLEADAAIFAGGVDNVTVTPVDFTSCAAAGSSSDERKLPNNAA